MNPPPLPEKLLVTTTEVVQGKNISKYLGPICGFSAKNLGLQGAFRLITERMELENYSELVSQVQQAALADLVERAESIQADGVVGVAFDFEFEGAICAATCSGTAVNFE